MVSEGDQTAFDLPAYLARIAYAGVREPTLETLRGVVLAHVTTIPFENLDIQLGRPIRLDIESLQAKLVRDRRGGYCFEQNHLLMAALRALGLDVTPLAARVRLGGTQPTPRTHMLLRVLVDDEPWIADAGFGGDGLMGPIRLEADQPLELFGWTHRLMRHDATGWPLWVLQLLRSDGWFDLYAFTEEPTPFIDYVMGNHFTSTQPESPFVRTVTAQLAGTERRLALRNRELVELRPDGGSEATVIDDDDDLLTVLAERFDLVFPAGTRFNALGQDGADSGPVVTI